MKLPTLFLLVAAVIVPPACQSDPPPTLGDRMFDHFRRAGQVQTALIAGDLEGARLPASWLAKFDGFEDVTELSGPWLEQLRDAAADIEQAVSIAEAAEATGRLGASCAGCHRASADGPRFQQMTSAPMATETVSHMMRHLWAMDRMWEGLISGSSQTWVSGASTIADDEPDHEVGGGAEVAALAELVHSQANIARSAALADRPAAYAGLIETCAACHTAIRVRGD